MKIKVAISKEKWLSEGDILEVELERQLRLGTQHQLANPAVRVREGRRPVNVDGKFVTVQVVGHTMKGKARFLHELKIIDVDLPRIMKHGTGYTASTSYAMWDDSDETRGPEPESVPKAFEGTRRFSVAPEGTLLAENDRRWSDNTSERKEQLRADERRRLQTAPLEGLSQADQAVVLDLCVALREAQRTDSSRQVAAIRRRIDAIRNKARKDRAA